MKTAVRNELMTWVGDMEDEDLLETLKLIKDSNPGKDWYDELSESEKESLNRGIADNQNNRNLSSEEFWRRM